MIRHPSHGRLARLRPGSSALFDLTPLLAPIGSRDRTISGPASSKVHFPRGAGSRLIEEERLIQTSDPRWVQVLVAACFRSYAPVCRSPSLVLFPVLGRERYRRVPSRVSVLTLLGRFRAIWRLFTAR